MKRRLVIKTQAENTPKKGHHELIARKSGIGIQQQEQYAALQRILDSLKALNEEIEFECIILAPTEKAVQKIDTLIIQSLQPKDEPEDEPTPMQKKILWYVKLGKTAKEIADTIHLSKYTIENHLKAMRYKYHVHKVTELLKLAEIKHWF